MKPLPSLATARRDKLTGLFIPTLRWENNRVTNYYPGHPCEVRALQIAKMLLKEKRNGKV